MKKVISLLLAVLIIGSLFTAMPVVSAADSNSDAETDVHFSSENGMGNMINNAIEGVEGDNGDINNKILEVRVQDNVATVSFNNAQPCKIIVGIFDEQGEEMVCSGMAEIDSENSDTAEVNLNNTQMPQYYVIKAFMLDGDNKPLCKAYESDYYTREIQQFMTMTVEDFSDSTVYNLDDSDDNNFAVFKDSAKEISTYQCNVLQSYDEETGTYVFTSINDEICGLNAGDVFYYKSDGDYVIIKVKEINIDFDTATIVEDKGVELDDVFECVKIDSTADSSNALVDMSDADEGVTLADEAAPKASPKSPYSTGAVELPFSKVLSKDFNIDKSYGNSTANVKVKGKVSEKLEVNLTIMLYLKRCTIDVNLKNELKINTTITGKLDKTYIKTGDFVIPVAGGINVHIEVSLVIQASATITFNATITSEKAFSVEVNTDGNHSFVNKSKPDNADIDINIEGEFYVGAKLDLRVSALAEIVNLGADFTPGVKVIASKRLDCNTEKHPCYMCIEGVVKLLADGNVYVKLQIFGKEFKKDYKFLSIEKKLLDFYVSSKSGVGKGKCPNIGTTYIGLPLGVYKLKSGQGIYKNYITGERFPSYNVVDKGYYVYIREIQKDSYGNVWGRFNYWYKTTGTNGTEKDVNRNAWLLLLGNDKTTYGIYQEKAPDTGSYITTGDVNLRAGPNYGAAPTYVSNGVTAGGSRVQVTDVEVRYQNDLLEWMFYVTDGSVKGFARDRFFTKDNKSAPYSTGATNHSNIATSGNHVEKTDTVPGSEYVLMVLKGDTETFDNNCDNLLYIAQNTSDDNGNVSFDYHGAFTGAVSTLVFGACNHTPSDWAVVEDADGNPTDKKVKVCTKCGEVIQEDYVTPVINGDANDDGVVDVRDVTYLQKAIAMTLALSERQLAACEVTGDGIVDVRDVTAIQRQLVGLD